MSVTSDIRKTQIFAIATAAGEHLRVDGLATAVPLNRAGHLPLQNDI